MLRSLRWAVPIAAVAATVLVARVAFPASPPELPLIEQAWMDVTGDVRSVDYATNGFRVSVTLAVAPGAREMSLLLNESGGMKPASFPGDVPDVWSGIGIDSDSCWRLVTLDGWPNLARSAAPECANSNKIVLSWWSQAAGTSAPYAWAYVPPIRIAVDRRTAVENRLVALPAGPDTTVTSEYNLDVDPTILAFHLDARASFLLHSAKLFATVSDECVGVADSDVVSSWRCSPPLRKGHHDPDQC